MILSLFVFIIAFIIFGLTCYRKETTYPIVIKLFGLVLIMYSALAYVVKLSGYSALSWEYAIYLMFYKIKITINVVSIIGIFGAAMYMLSGIMTAYICTKEKRLAIFLIPIIIFFVINLPYITEKIYIKLIIKENGEQAVEFARNIIVLYSSVVMAFLFVYPYYIIFKQYVSTKLCKRKRELMIIAVSCALSDLLVAQTVFVGKIYNYMFFGMELSNYPRNIVPLGSKIIFVATSIIAIMAIVFLILRYAPVRKFLKQHTSGKYIFENSREIFMIMHTYKNIFAAIRMYANYKDDEYAFIGSSEKRLDIIGMLAEEQLEKLNDTLNAYKLNKDNLGEFKYISLSECTNNAIKRSGADLKVLNIAVEVEQDIKILSNEYYLIECMICLINNSCEAVARNDGEKIVKITIGRENDSAYFEVYDNGCGISWKNKNKICKPFFSTKRGVTNYGIGLSYVKKTVEILGGDFYIQSKVNEYTKAQITLRLGENV